MNTIFKNIYPRSNWVNENCQKYKDPYINDERFGGFLVPFIAGAAVSAPFWLVAGSNKAKEQVYYPYPPQYQTPYPYYQQYNPMPNVYVNGPK